ncbi:MmcQ/YjbR family DNA-binding protein [Streptomyces sp. P38-E01]|uniref:MmcQ/YjbR family DNA-binding protein n=1 Tax=Streptomyces tardus TaxID=2780544 RepID=A0A949JDV8_9ACTN|nr:MmcQ/YjbR family DNA-binding protein [Streptomyces tardus]MBU7596654.1 MmcQ/YjbR family DNA-binding protein [Streptomyces tardus]
MDTDDRRDPLERLRECCLALPEAHEGTTVHHPSFKVRDRTFAIHADREGPDVWIKSTAEEQQELIASDTDRFFKPPYLGPKGWVGVHLDREPPWDEIAELITEGYRLAAPKRLVARLDESAD